MLYAVFDPNWGEPKVIPETLRQTPEAAKIAAASHPDHTLYSGAQTHVVPTRLGSWGNMVKHGYTVREVTVTPI